MKRRDISVLAGGALLLLLLGCAATPGTGEKPGESAEEVRSIASAFMCDCDLPECVNMGLDRCYCDYAVEARMYIRQLLASGKHTREEILQKVHKKFGGRIEGGR